MSNRLTRVPEQPVPPLPGWGRRCVPPADAVMRALLSRPSSGSLAVTWVTPGTLLLAAVLVVAGLGAGALCLVEGIGGSRPGVTALGAVALLLAVTSAPLAVVGAAQRRALASTRARRST